MARTPGPSKKSSYLAAGAGLLIAVAIVRYPEASFEASLDGLLLWFNVVLPALFPFFTMAEILMGLGVIHGLGVLLEPVMRKTFRIPGVGGFAVAMGLASGYPLGAKISGQIRRDNLCSREEGERLISLANTADPLFMMGAVAVGMFAVPELGLVLAVSHYLAVICVGLILRYHAGGLMQEKVGRRKNDPIFPRAFAALVEARQKDARPFGELLRDAVRESMNAMLFVGGCIMMFSVLIRVLTVAGFIEVITVPITSVLGWFGLDSSLVPALITGTLEITIGAQNASLAQTHLLHKAVAASAIIGWSGFSVHAQVAAMVYGTDIRMSPYITARLLHALLAAALTFVLFEPLGGAAATLAAVATDVAHSFPALNVPVFAYWSVAGLGIASFLLLLLIASLILRTLERFRIVIFRVRGPGR